jgi:hypothetical protein
MLDPKLFMQLDITEPLRLSPKTFINRYDDDYFMVGLFDQDNARKFLAHLVTSIYAFCSWNTPENLIPMWPQETINDLMQVIISLKKEHILLNQQEYADLVTKLTPEETLEEKNFLKDKNWIEPYLKALETISEDSFVLDNGAFGAGYFARHIAEKNVQKVVATSEDLQNILRAREIARDNCLFNTDFIFVKPHNLSPVCYAEKFNVYLTELFSHDLFEKRVLESAIYSRKFLLSPNCRFIPARIDLKVFAYQSPVHRDMVQESKEFEILYGLKFGAFTEAMKNHLMGVYTRLDPETTIKLSDDYTIKTFDLSTLEDAAFTEDFELTITTSGKITGFCTFFELHLNDNIQVNNSPFEPNTKYMQRIFTPADSIYLQPGESINLKATYSSVFRLLISDR